MPDWTWPAISRRVASRRVPATRRLRTAAGWLTPLIFLACAWPACRWAAGFIAGALGPDPIAALTHASGWWAMSLLLATLSVTPLRRLSVAVSRSIALRLGRRIGDWNALVRQRRQLGLWSFGYACLHAALYLGFDAQTLQAYAQDLVERRFVALGSLAWLALLPLALTSNQCSMRRLKRHWTRLHRLAYAAVALAALHGVLQAKLGQPSGRVFATLAFGLLAIRLAMAGWAGLTARAAVRTAASAAPAARRCDAAPPACGRRQCRPTCTTRRSPRSSRA